VLQAQAAARTLARALGFPARRAPHASVPAELLEQQLQAFSAALTTRPNKSQISRLLSKLAVGAEAVASHPGAGMVSGIDCLDDNTCEEGDSDADSENGKQSNDAGGESRASSLSHAAQIQQSQPGSLPGNPQSPRAASSTSACASPEGTSATAAGRQEATRASFSDAASQMRLGAATMGTVESSCNDCTKVGPERELKSGAFAKAVKEQDAERVPTCEDANFGEPTMATLHSPVLSSNVAGRATDNSADVARQAPGKELQRALQHALQGDLQAAALKKAALAIVIHAVCSIPSIWF
jgi:hypothetical protein